MTEALIALFVIINLFVVVKYYRSELGVFQAPFLACSASIAIFLPQLTSMYQSDYYDLDLMPRLLFVMCTCNMAFTIGFEVAKSKPYPKFIRDLDLKKSKRILIFLSMAGLFAAFSMRGVWMSDLEAGSSEKSNFIVLVNLSYYLEIGFIYSLIYLTSFKTRDKIIIAIIVLASLSYLDVVLLLGRRNLALRLVLNLLFILALNRPKTYKFTKVLLIVLFLFGSILNASIGTIRTNMSGKTSEDIDYSNNLEESFAQKDFTIGMDVGNAALGIDYCYQNNSYDYGLNIWNGFIYNFVPRFLIGDELKKSLLMDFGYRDIVPVLTKNITTMTGYFDAFASFSYFAFIKFLLLGYILGIMWSRSLTSEIYLLVYMFLFSQVTSAFTHGTQYVFMRLEFLLLFFFPIVSIYVFKFNPRLNNSSSKA